MEVFLGRQPILDAGQKTVAYELLYRSSVKQNAYPGPEIDGASATSSLLYNVFYTIGLKEVTGGKKAFVNFTRELLLANIPDILSPKEVIIEVLEDVQIDTELVEALAAMAQKGFILALDDFIYKEGVEPLVSLASIVKIDWRTNNREEILNLTNILKKHNVLLLAEKVETFEEFSMARDLGYKFFQGFFFAKPVILKGKSIPVTVYNWLDILSAIQKPELDIDEVVGIVNKNPSLSYQLLKIINSARYGLVRPISSIKQAILLLGEREIRRWLSLLILTKIGSQKPLEILVSASIRAKFGELVALELEGEEVAQAVFFMGLLSLLDVIVGRPLDELLPPLPLDERIVQALLEDKGPLAIYMRTIRACEVADHRQIEKNAIRLGLGVEKLARLYIEAIKWSQVFCSV